MKSTTKRKNSRSTRRPKRDAVPADPGVRKTMLRIVDDSFVPSRMGPALQQTREPSMVSSPPSGAGNHHAADALRRRRGAKFGTTKGKGSRSARRP